MVMIFWIYMFPIKAVPDKSIYHYCLSLGDIFDASTGPNKLKYGQWTNKDWVLLSKTYQHLHKLYWNWFFSIFCAQTGLFKARKTILKLSSNNHSTIPVCSKQCNQTFNEIKQSNEIEQSNAAKQLWWMMACPRPKTYPFPPR